MHVTHIKVPKASDMAYAILKPYFDADYDAVIDINTRIPVIRYNNEYLLNYFNIPIWHYILDHPYIIMKLSVPPYTTLILYVLI